MRRILEFGDVDERSPPLARYGVALALIALATFLRWLLSAVLGEALPRLDGIRILVIDDESDASEVVAELLTSSGAEVRQASSAQAAREVAAEWLPQLLVSDVGMPGEDGCAFIAGWRLRPGDESQIPAVALTAYAARSDRIQLLSAGFNAHVPKPLDPAELITVVASLARSSQRPD